MDMLNCFKTNVLGVSHFLAIFAPLLRHGSKKKAVVISSGAGDTNWVIENEVFSQSPYAISKAAVNMVVAKFHVQYKNEGIVFVAISPGIVDTDFLDTTDMCQYHLPNTRHSTKFLYI